MDFYDELICECKMPIEGCNETVFRTISMVNPKIDFFKIGKDKQLYKQRYDLDGSGDRLINAIDPFEEAKTRVNKRYEKNHYTGEVRFYESDSEVQIRLEFSAYFINGKLKELVHIQGVKKRLGAAKGLLADKIPNNNYTDEESRDDAIDKE